MLYPINEIFYSIQGEGYHAGKPAVFIRLAGCNLNCSFCDTVHSMSGVVNEDEISKEVRQLWPDDSEPFVVITGGEPTEHDLEDLLRTLSMDGIVIAIETNGTGKYAHKLTTWDCVRYFNWVTLSPKHNLSEITNAMVRLADEIKLVFEDGVAGTEETIRRLELFDIKKNHLLIQPCSEDFKPAVDFVLKNPEWRLSIQQQKIIGVR